jgi:hypothetical protein
VGAFTDVELAAGVDLTAQPTFPTTAASLKVLARLEQRKADDGGPEAVALAQPRAVAVVVRPAPSSKK